MSMAVHKDTYDLWESSISKKEFRQITRGDRIAYRLLPSALPTNEQREWHGYVCAIGDESVVVKVLDEGYIGEAEVVWRMQIVSILRD